MIGEELLALGEFVRGGRTGEDVFEGGLDEVVVVYRPVSRCFGELPCQKARLIQREGAVGDRESLLRDDAFAAAVAIVDVGGVKEDEELHLLFVGMAKIDAAAARRFAELLVNVGAAERCIEAAADVEDAIADEFRFEAAGVHVPEGKIIGIDFEVGFGDLATVG